MEIEKIKREKNHMPWKSECKIWGKNSKQSVSIMIVTKHSIYSSISMCVSVCLWCQNESNGVMQRYNWPRKCMILSKCPLNFHLKCSFAIAILSFLRDENIKKGIHSQFIAKNHFFRSFHFQLMPMSLLLLYSKNLKMASTHILCVCLCECECECVCASTHRMRLTHDDVTVRYVASIPVKT